MGRVELQCLRWESFEVGCLDRCSIHVNRAQMTFRRFIHPSIHLFLHPCPQSPTHPPIPPSRQSHATTKSLTVRILKTKCGEKYRDGTCSRCQGKGFTAIVCVKCFPSSVGGGGSTGKKPQMPGLLSSSASSSGSSTNERMYSSTATTASTSASAAAGAGSSAPGSSAVGGSVSVGDGSSSSSESNSFDGFNGSNAGIFSVRYLQCWRSMVPVAIVVTRGSGIMSSRLTTNESNISKNNKNNKNENNNNNKCSTPRRKILT